MNIIRLRAHHGMCLAFFEGKGYSQGFTSHMQSVLDGMEADPMLELITEADVVCQACPNLQNGLCNTPELVLDFDRQVLSLCGLEGTPRLPWSEFSRLVLEIIIRPGKRESICGGCQWSDICKARESTPNF